MQGGISAVNSRITPLNSFFLQSRFPLDKVFKIQVLPVEDGVGEKADPVTQYRDACRGTEHQIQFDVSVAVDEEIDVGMAFQVFFGVEHQILLVLTHVVGFPAIDAFQSAMLGPVQSKFYAPARMYGGEERLQGPAVEHGTEEFELPVRVAQAVAVRQVELLAVYFRGEWFAVDDDAALRSQVVAAPDVMVADEEMYFHAQVRQLGQFAQETGITSGYDCLELIPEVEHVSQQVDGGSFVLDAVEEIDKTPLLSPPMFDGS